MVRKTIKVKKESAESDWKLKPVEYTPVVQSIVSLTSSLRGQLVKCFTTISTYRGLTGGVLLLQNFSVAISVSPHV